MGLETGGGRGLVAVCQTAELLALETLSFKGKEIKQDWGDGSEGKEPAVPSRRTRARIPSIHIKAGTVVCICNPSWGWGRDVDR